MPWTEAQRRYLREMGIAPWLPAAASLAPSQAGGADDGPAAYGPATSDDTLVLERPVAVPTAPPVSSAAPPHAPGLAPVVVRGPRPDVATLDWPALREAVAQCTACKLCERRRNTVFGVGSTTARWMVVGEAPGEQEDREGEPFVGKAGQLLDQMLAAIGLTRGEGPPERQVYIANTLKCRPPQNRNPEPEELAQCEPFLVRQLALVRPRVVIAMGRFAVQSLLRSTEPIGRLRGRVHHYEGVPLIVTYHPAYLLRQPADKARAWDDLCLAREVALQASAPAGPDSASAER